MKGILLRMETKTILTEWFWFPFLLLQISYNCNIEFNV